jgi:hypothetical protein
MHEQQRHEQLLEVIGKLAGVIEEQLASIRDRLEHLSEVVREAVEELGVIRDIEDEKASDLQWAVRNGQPLFQLASMPLDPAAPDWNQQLNRLSPADLPSDDTGCAAEGPTPCESPGDEARKADPARPAKRSEQGHLWPPDERLC